jgi:uncharacterized membrane protein (Fun14 family)
LIDYSYSITTGLGSLVGAGGVGFLIGFAIKKIIKILLVILGIFFGAVLALQYYGFLAVRWDNINKSAQQLIDNANLTGAHIGVPHFLTDIVNNLGIPITSGFAIGLFLGFAKG